eukprot:sb/3472119/
MKSVPCTCRERAYPGAGGVPRPRQPGSIGSSCGDRPLTVVSNSSMNSTNSKRSSGSSFTMEPTNFARPRVEYVSLAYPGAGGVPRPRQPGSIGSSCGDRPLTVVSNSSMNSTNSKRSSGSSFTMEPSRQLSLDRSGRPVSDALDSGVSFRSSNNSILSNRYQLGLNPIHIV